jgi:hypothetical protein
MKAQRLSDMGVFGTGKGGGCRNQKYQNHSTACGAKLRVVFLKTTRFKSSGDGDSSWLDHCEKLILD